ncbi:MAG TPA: hypothetical protein VD866_02030 [Urbifossiella sp.]|nr:hypothetical protein [Urbifossiella sp.]
MRLQRQVARLTGLLAGPRPKGVPTDPAALLAGLRDGMVTMDDLERTDADQMSAVAYAAAMLISRLTSASPRMNQAAAPPDRAAVSQHLDPRPPAAAAR